MQNDLNKRLFDFAVKCICFIRSLPEQTEYRVIKYQLIKSATSSGANYEEAQAGSSRADFNHKIRITLREMRETNYWMRIIDAIQEQNTKSEELKWLVNESLELKKILGSIVQKTRS